MTRKSTLIAICLLPMLAQAQPQPRRDMSMDREKLESLEAAYLTRELNLSPDDAQKFWPVFNKYREEVKGVNTNTAITDPLEKQQKILDLRKKYRGDFGRILGQERGQSVFSAEDRFRQKVQGAMELRKKAGERRPMMQQRLQERRRNTPRVPPTPPVDRY
jgi:hypothetical protein